MEQQKIVLVIGGSSGIGLAVAQKSADRGDTVYCAARTSCPDSRIISLTADVTDPQTVTDAVQKAVTDRGRIDCLVYCAGYSMAAPVEYADERDYRYLYEVNFFGALHAVRCVLPYMRRRKSGRIVLIGSMGGVLPIAYDAFYSSSKAALDMLGKELNMEVNPLGIFVTTVLPGGTATRFTFKRNVYPAEAVGEYADDMQKSVGSLAGIEQGGMEASAVADTILSVLDADAPPVSVAAGGKNKTYYLSQKILPARLTQYMVESTYHITHR